MSRKAEKMFERTQAPPRLEPSLPPGVRLAAAWSWRVIVIVAATALVSVAFVELREVFIPVLVALVLSAVLVPFRDLLTLRLRFPRWLAIATAELGLILLMVFLLFLVVTQVAGGLDGLQDRATAAFTSLEGWLATSPLHLGSNQLAGILDQAWRAIQANVGAILPGLLSAGSTVGHVLVGVLLALFTSLFILIDGRRIWSWLVRLLPRRARGAVDGAGRAGWTTLQSFVKVQIFVALVDAVGIAGGAALLGVPFAIPIGVLVFLGSFIPVIGAIVTGAFAVGIALIYNGWVIALCVLAVVLLVQQIEGHVLQPLVMGSAVKVHPLAVVLAVAAGSTLAGIAGAFFAVPLVAVANAFVLHIAGGTWRDGASPTPDGRSAEATAPTKVASSVRRRLRFR